LESASISSASSFIVDGTVSIGFVEAGLADEVADEVDFDELVDATVGAGVGAVVALELAE